MHSFQTRLILVLCFSFACVIYGGAVAADGFVGVKEGDWIEYNVVFTGDLSQGHDVVWARMEIMEIQGATISLNITTRSTNGTLRSGAYILNLETGELGDDFIIPANLNVGDAFYDKNQGNITISSLEKKNVAGAQRDVLFGANPDTGYQWDRTTGVLVEAYSQYPAYTIATKVDKTNLWQPQILGLEQTPFYILLAVIVVVMLLLVGIVIFRRRTQLRHR